MLETQIGFRGKIKKADRRKDDEAFLYTAIFLIFGTPIAALFLASYLN